MKQILLLSTNIEESEKLHSKLQQSAIILTNHIEVSNFYDKIIVLFDNTDFKSFKDNMTNALEMRKRQEDGQILFLGTKADQPLGDFKVELKRFCLHYNMTHFNISTEYNYNIRKVRKYILTDEL